MLQTSQPNVLPERPPDICTLLYSMALPDLVTPLYLLAPYFEDTSYEVLRKAQQALVYLMLML